MTNGWPNSCPPLETVFARTTFGTVPTDKKFTGQRLDSTGLYYYNARYYDSTIGRFISADTIVPDPANPQTLNRYSYVLNNPLKYTDPTGHDQIIVNMGDNGNGEDWYCIYDGDGDLVGIATGLDDMASKSKAASSSTRGTSITEEALVSTGLRKSSGSSSVINTIEILENINLLMPAGFGTLTGSINYTWSGSDLSLSIQTKTTLDYPKTSSSYVGALVTIDNTKYRIPLNAPEGERWSTINVVSQEGEQTFRNVPINAKIIVSLSVSAETNTVDFTFPSLHIVTSGRNEYIIQ